MMTDTQARPDQRTIDGFRAIVNRMPFSGGEFVYRGDYLWYADWSLNSGQFVILSISDNDEIIISSSMLGAEMPGIGLTGTRFSSIALEPGPGRRIAVHTQEELVELAYKLVYNRH